MDEFAGKGIPVGVELLSDAGLLGCIAQGEGTNLQALVSGIYTPKPCIIVTAEMKPAAAAAWLR